VDVHASSDLRTRLVIVIALFLSLGGGGFFAILALDEGTRDELACSQVGCSSGIDAVVWDARRTFHRASTVEFCANGECRSVRVAAANVVGTEWATRKLDTHTVYTLDLYIRDRLGRVLMHGRAHVRLHKFEPNGHACGQNCYSAGLRLDAARRRLVPARS
jgi:hypothetical protein